MCRAAWEKPGAGRFPHCKKRAWWGTMLASEVDGDAQKEEKSRRSKQQ
jgi:hypothetical protein